MQAPVLAIFYNMLMGATDAFDRLKLNRNTSLELCIISNSWSKKMQFALLDQAITNSYIIYKYHHPHVEHHDFVELLHGQLLAMALGRPVPGTFVVL